MAQPGTNPVNSFILAAAQDLLKGSPTNNTAADDAEAEKKKKNVAAQTGDNAVLQGMPPVFTGAFKSLMSNQGNQF